MIDTICAIEITMKGKRSWKKFKDSFKGSDYPFPDLRTASKTNIPVLIEVGCCDDALEIRRVKDFPLQDKKCKCGKAFLIKWNDLIE